MAALPEIPTLIAEMEKNRRFRRRCSEIKQTWPGITTDQLDEETLHNWERLQHAKESWKNGIDRVDGLLKQLKETTRSTMADLNHRINVTEGRYRELDDGQTPTAREADLQAFYAYGNALARNYGFASQEHWWQCRKTLSYDNWPPKSYVPPPSMDKEPVIPSIEQEQSPSVDEDTAGGEMYSCSHCDEPNGTWLLIPCTTCGKWFHITCTPLRCRQDADEVTTDDLGDMDWDCWKCEGDPDPHYPPPSVWLQQAQQRRAAKGHRAPRKISLAPPRDAPARQTTRAAPKKAATPRAPRNKRPHEGGSGEGTTTPSSKRSRTVQREVAPELYTRPYSVARESRADRYRQREEQKAQGEANGQKWPLAHTPPSSA
ncbi:transcription initiation factor TFIID subunit 3 isoform X1 [Lecanosticta acicola]|uniref:Transcription initiation factor TFIID subunit 3 isoform X1 n=1 Tax=Lecanosticta acicola TaxID=111012 RepID=A0AAI8YYY2_9PEZI|nr:transcription initiation factor TFIID subunit 3 isoform X1 [Lecanosticta acicola]